MTQGSLRRSRWMPVLVASVLVVGTAATADARARCPLVPDPSGDTGIVGRFLTETVPDDPSLDLLSLDVASSADRLGIVVGVKKLARTADQMFDVHFIVGGTRFIVYAYVPREPGLGQPQFTVGYADPTDPVDRYTPLGQVAGRVDAASSKISVVIDTKVLASRARLQRGVRLTEVEADSYRAFANGEVILLSDFTDSTGSYVFGTRGCVPMPRVT